MLIRDWWRRRHTSRSLDAFSPEEEAVLRRALRPGVALPEKVLHQQTETALLALAAARAKAQSMPVASPPPSQSWSTPHVVQTRHEDGYAVFADVDPVTPERALEVLRKADLLLHMESELRTQATETRDS